MLWLHFLWKYYTFHTIFISLVIYFQLVLCILKLLSNYFWSYNALFGLWSQVLIRNIQHVLRNVNKHCFIQIFCFFSFFLFVLYMLKVMFLQFMCAIRTYLRFVNYKWLFVQKASKFVHAVVSPIFTKLYSSTVQSQYCLHIMF